MMTTPLQLVSLYSGAEADAGAVRALETHLAPLIRQGLVEHRHVQGLQGGERRSQIDAALREADVVLCVLSSDFMADRALMEQAESAAGDECVRVLPMLWRKTELAGTVFADRMETAGGVVASLDPDRAFVSLVKELRRQAQGPEEEARGLRWRSDREDLLARVGRVCQLREDKAGRKVRLQHRTGPAPFGQVLEVRYDDDFGEHSYLVAVLPRPPQREDLRALADLLRERYTPFDSMAYAELVYLKPEINAELEGEAKRWRIRPVTLTRYQGLIDFDEYLRQQTGGLKKDLIYPPALYVPQRMVYTRGFGSQELPAKKDALSTLLAWVEDFGEPRFALVLGEFGTGKTFLLHQLALKLAESQDSPVPILIRLRSLERAHTLDALLSAHLAAAGMERIDLPAFRYLLREGRVALLFDGFDELAVRVGYDRATDHLATLAQAAQGNAKIIVTSRTQHFLSDDQVKTALARHIEALPGQHLVQLLPFDYEEIRVFLKKMLGDDVLAAARFALIEDVKDLLGLSHNPRMLSFIAKLPEDRLRAARDRGEVTAAHLYQELLDWWLDKEDARARRPGSEEGLAVAQRWLAIEKLAERLWAQTDAWIHGAELGEAVAGALAKLKDLSAAAHEVGSGTLLCRDKEGRFSFVHQSVTEWLVAKVAARQLEAGHTELLGLRAFSPLMADFFADLAGPARASEWARGVLRDGAAGDLLRKNALLLRQRQRLPLGAMDLHGQDLRERSFARQDLRGADLQNADLRGVDLTEVDLRGADLRRANLQGATLLGADLGGAKLAGANLRRARLVGALVDERALVDTDHWGAALEGPPAVVAGGGWRDACYGVALSPDGALLAAGMNNGAVWLWNTQTGEPLRVLHGHDNRVWGVSFRADGLRLASGSDDKTVRLWDTQTGAPLLVFQGHEDSVSSVSLSADGRRLASGSADKTVRLWDTQTGEILRVLHGHNSSVNSVSLSGDGLCLASGSDDNTVQLWDTQTGAPLRVLRGHDSLVLSVSLSGDRLRLASGSIDRTVRLWEAQTGKPLHVLHGHEGYARSVSLSGDGLRLASGSFDNTVRLWDTQIGELLRVLRGHQGYVWSVSFSQNGRHLASSSDDGTIRLWDSEAGECLAILVPAKEGWAALTPDGRYKRAGVLNGEVWHVINRCRYELGELEPYFPLRLPTDHKFLSSSVLEQAAPALAVSLPSAVPSSPYAAVGARLAAESQLGLLSEDWLRLALLAVEGRPVSRSRPTPALMGRTERALAAALRFLKDDVGLAHLALLPSLRLLLLLARFFSLFTAPIPRSRELLSRWLWRCAVAGPPQRIEDARQMLMHLPETAQEEPSLQALLAGPLLDLALPSIDKLKPDGVSTRPALAALFALKPRHLGTGEAVHRELDPQALFNPDPEAPPPLQPLWPTHGRGLLTSLANFVLHPAINSASLRVALRAAPLSVLTSHAVSAEAFAALQQNDVATFLRLRLATLQAHVDQFLRRKLHLGEFDRPSIADLAWDHDIEG